jgi:antitoxin component of MazEF toxin-antitoxin module
MRLPKSAAQEVCLRDGSAVDVRVKNGEIIVRPMRRTRFKLAELLKAIHPRNIHAEVDAGAARGRELL